MAIRYVCDYCGDLAPASFNEDRTQYEIPLDWYSLDRQDWAVLKHFCGASCLRGHLSGASVLDELKGEAHE